MSFLPVEFFIYVFSAFIWGAVFGKWLEARRWRKNVNQDWRVSSGRGLYKVTLDQEFK